MRFVWMSLLFLVVTTVSILGFRGSLSPRPPLELFNDMDRQSKYKPQAESQFFADHRTDRPVPAHTVARGRTAEADPAFLGADEHMYRGFRGEPAATPEETDWYHGFPDEMEINEALFERGQQRYTVFCTPCHGQLGDGNGITKQYGMAATPSWHEDRFRTMAEGQIFDTITNGRNTMLGYGDRVPVADRWAIIAYVRALQRAHQGSVEDVPPADRSDLGL